MRFYYHVIVMDSYGPELVNEHRHLVQAIKSRDPELARTRATEHLTNTGRRSSQIDLRSANFGVDDLLGIEAVHGRLPAAARGATLMKRVPARRRKVLIR